MATQITFQINSHADIQHAISQLQFLNGAYSASFSQTASVARDVPVAQAPRLSDNDLISEFRSSDYEFRTAGGLLEDLGEFYSSKDDITQHLEGLVSSGKLRTARRSRDGARLYALA